MFALDFANGLAGIPSFTSLPAYAAGKNINDGFKSSNNCFKSSQRDSSDEDEYIKRIANWRRENGLDNA